MISSTSGIMLPRRSFSLSGRVAVRSTPQVRGPTRTVPSANLNQVTLIGRAGSAPDIKFLDSGAEKSVANFSIAVNRSYARDSETDWFDCELWDKNAQMAADYIKKGAKVCVTGSLITNKWVDKQTSQQRKSVKIRVKSFELLDTKMDGNGAGMMEGGQPQYGNNQQMGGGPMQSFDNASYNPGSGGQPSGVNMPPGGGYTGSTGYQRPPF